jgi:hypothetical protein
MQCTHDSMLNDLVDGWSLKGYRRLVYFTTTSDLCPTSSDLVLPRMPYVRPAACCDQSHGLHRL